MISFDFICFKLISVNLNVFLLNILNVSDFFICNTIIEHNFQVYELKLNEIK